MDGLEEVERIAGALLLKLEASERRRLLRAVARDLRGSQARRIVAQTAPDGSAYTPRKRREPPSQGKFAVRFLYPKGAAEPRLVFMKSWVHEGPLITGFDIEAGGVRSFFFDKVDQWLPVEPNQQNKGAGKLRRKGTIRRAAMFRKLANGRNLKSGATDAEAWVGFSGRAAEIAGIHQEGQMDRPAAKARPVRYARRTLLGLTEAERKSILDMLFAHVAG